MAGVGAVGESRPTTLRDRQSVGYQRGLFVCSNEEDCCAVATSALASEVRICEQFDGVHAA